MPLEPLQIPFGTFLKPQYRNGLVGHWKMNVGGVLLPDLSGNNNHGTRTNYDWTATSGWVGQGDALDGVNDYVVSNLSKTAIGNTLTISMWIKPTGAQTEKGIMQIADILASTMPWILFQRSSSTSVKWYLNDNYQITQTINDNIWYYIALTYDRTTWQAYKNGIADGIYVGLVGPYPGSYTWFGNGYGGYFNGLIDDVRIYNRALSAYEVRHSCFQQEDEWDLGLDDDIDIMQGVPIELLQSGNLMGVR